MPDRKVGTTVYDGQRPVVTFLFGDPMRNSLKLLGALVVYVALILLFIAADSFLPPPVTAFYTDPAPLSPGKPGDLLRVADWPAPPGMRAWRILYRSTDVDGQPAAVSGTIFAPAAPAPKGGFPMVAVAHGTSGIGQFCAPSLLMNPNRTTFPDMLSGHVAPLVEAGYAVVMSDYAGMGAPGRPSYLVGDTEGKNVLDAARVLQHFAPVPVQQPFVVWGHSQGGHAAAFAGQLAASYAPDLDIAGVAMTAPAAELGLLVDTIMRTDHQGADTGLAMMVAGAWSRAYADARADAILTKSGLSRLIDVEGRCVFGEVSAFSDAPPSTYLKANPARTPIWREYIALNTPGSLPTNAPILVMQGEADEIVLPWTTDAFVRRLCQLGNTVNYKRYDGATHFTVVKPARPDLLAWMADRIAGRPAPSICRTN